MNSSPIVFRLTSGSVTPASRREEPVGRLHVHERHLEVPRERLLDLIGLPFAVQAVVDEHARELVADRPVHEQRRDRRVDPSAQRAEHLRAADLRPDARRPGPR